MAAAQILISSTRSMQVTATAPQSMQHQSHLSPITAHSRVCLGLAGDVAPTTSSSSSSTSANGSAPPGPQLLVMERRGPVQPLQLLPGETVFYEGSGAGAELALSLLLAATLIYIPLTIASIGKKLWIKYTFTNKRVVITNSSPLFSRTVSNA